MGNKTVKESCEMNADNLNFILNREVTIDTEYECEPVRRAVKRFCRDMEMVLEPVNTDKKEDWIKPGKIHLKKGGQRAEEFCIQVNGPFEITVQASEELGFIYALFYISEHFMGILPFWFWNDQKFTKKTEIAVPSGEYGSTKRPVQFRGWFINDEVLISHWAGGRNAQYPWEMAFEALLRCGGNTVIPGTDSNSKLYADLAGDMGLWITQHHAEPLGAEMFLRAYPDKTPSFREYPDLFRGLWEEGIKRQRKYKIIWNLGFRGQGDAPFWENDPLYDTPEKRGGLISSIMKEQYNLVKRYVSDPVFSANLYGETMELYQQGFLKLPDNVIMIWADNGYGKMVSRRQGNHNPRVTALPGKGLQNQRHGAYYHVSFYDLQAANVLTMLPNSMEFVEEELNHAYECGIKTLWLINCSNIKPHTYPLDFIASLWNGTLEPQTAKKLSETHLERYIRQYYGSSSFDEMKRCFRDYFKAALPYGEREDEHAGEQFYNYVTRILIHQWMKDGGHAPSEELKWCIPAESLEEQIRWYAATCEDGYEAFQALFEECSSLKERLPEDAGRLWADSLLLQTGIHTCCIEGVIHFGRGFQAYQREEYFSAFYEIGLASDFYEKADRAMKECSHDKWKGFYENDCQTDIKETAYQLRMLMGYIRNLGDGPYYYQWQRQVIYPEKDRKIMLLLNYENHLTDQELYEAMKEKHGEITNGL